MRASEPVEFFVDGIIVRHQAGSMPVMCDIIEKNTVEVLVELGTFKGGFALYFNQEMPDLEIITFDNTKFITDETLDVFSSKVTFIQTDILVETEPVVTILERKKKTLLYCDNGNKPEEVRLYAEHLKTGDILGVHDWGTEISLGDVGDIITEDDFSAIELETFMSNGWISRFWEKL